MSKKYLCKDCGNTTLIPQDKCLSCNGLNWRMLTENESIYGVDGAKKLEESLVVKSKERKQA